MDSGQDSEFQLQLPPDVDAAHTARHFVQEHSAHLPAACRDDMELLVSELVTNAVRHGQPDIVLTLSFALPLVGVAVHDQGAQLPSSTTKQAPPDATGGRGLMIVDRLASSWGVIPADLPPGKTVWFHLSAPDARSV